MLIFHYFHLVNIAILFVEIYCKISWQELLNDDQSRSCLSSSSSSSKTGLIYLFVPARSNNDEFETRRLETGRRESRLVFRLNHYYSLLALSKLFKASRHDRLLFYYVNEAGRPQSNHYNQWLTDTFWRSRVPMSAVNMIQLNYSYSGYNFSMYEIVERIRRDCVHRFDSPKEKFLLITSDVIIGPMLQLCFTRDLVDVSSSSYSSVNVESLRSSTPSECYNALKPNSTNFYSLVYNLEMTHKENDFSGIVLWNSDFINSPLKLNSSLLIESSPYNIYKCHYRQDVLPSPRQEEENNLEYAHTFCIFGFESALFDAPVLQHVYTPANNYFSILMRKWLFHNSEPITYRRKLSKEPKIPNIVHLIWFGQKFKGLKFIEYLCLKSILSVLKPDKVKIHGDIEPNCELWKKIKQHPKVEWVHMERPLFKHGQNFSGSPIQHLADVARLEVIYNEGGIYSDFDILWVKPIDKLRYMDVELIASNDLTSYCPQFPNNIQIGTFLAPPKSEFVRMWLDGYREKYHLFPGDYVAVSMCEPYKLYEKDPTKVLIDNRLQMIYFNGWSVFIPRYIDVDQDNLQQFNDKLDWLNDGTYGYHLPRHGALYTREDYDSSNKSTLPMKIASYILNLPENVL